MNNHLQYAGMKLDRCDALRRQPEAIAQLWRGEQVLLVLLWQGKILFRIAASPDNTASGEQLSTLLVRRADVSVEMNALFDRSAGQIFLGQQDGNSYFAIDIADADNDAVCAELQAKFIDLRSVGAVLPRAEAALLAYARGIVFWRQQNRFCSSCGHGLNASSGGHVLTCGSEECGRETYPRTDPAVIMLVERIGPGGVKQCLLGRHPNWPIGSFSTLAGFVEPGESLEEAVQREVAEESGVVVGEVKYLASQPWPFPASIMLGFFAQALNSEITLDPHELAEADWFSKDDLAGFGVWGDESSSRNLPRKDSIARFLIDHWLNES